MEKMFQILGTQPEPLEQIMLNFCINAFQKILVAFSKYILQVKLGDLQVLIHKEHKLMFLICFQECNSFLFTGYWYQCQKKSNKNT